MSRSPVLSPFRKQDHAHYDCVRRALSALETECRRRGLRLTRLRRRVFELVLSTHEPVKAYDLLDRLRSEQRGAAPPTVYRALDFLRKEGFVHRIESLNAYVGCGAPGRRHSGQFLICRHCGAVAEMADTDVADLLARKADGLGFHMDGGTVEIRGQCPQCARRSDKRGAEV